MHDSVYNHAQVMFARLHRDDGCLAFGLLLIHLAVEASAAVDDKLHVSYDVLSVFSLITIT